MSFLRSHVAEAVTRRLAKILRLPLNLAALRTASNEWEFRISNLVAQDDELAEEVRKLEEQYDNQLLEMDGPDLLGGSDAVPTDGS